MSTWRQGSIFISIGDPNHPTKEMRSAYLSENELFAFHETFEGHPEHGFSVTHVPTGLCLSRYHENSATAKLYIAIWRALPIQWDEIDESAIRATALPAPLRRWIDHVKP